MLDNARMCDTIQKFVVTRPLAFLASLPGALFWYLSQKEKLMKRQLFLITIILWLCLPLMGCTEETAIPTSEPLALEVTGQVEDPSTWTQAELRGLGTRQVEYTDKRGNTNTYTGTPVMTLLEASGLAETADAVTLVGSDGYTVEVLLSELGDCPDCIVAFDANGTLDMVLPGFTSKVQVRDIVELGVLSKGTPEVPPISSADVPLLAEPLTITDAVGRELTFTRLPQRIMIIGRGPYMALHILYMFPEGPERLIAAEAKSASASDFLSTAFPNFDEIPTTTANPGPEQIAAYQPDLVIMKSLTVEEMSESLAQVDIPVMYVGLETPEQFFHDVRNMGQILGNTERAKEIVAFYQSRIDRIINVTEELLPEEKPRTLLLQYNERGGEVAVQVPAPSWMQTIQVRIAGGRPVWTGDLQVTDGWTVTNFEQIAAWNPEKIFVVIWYTLDSEDVIAGLKADPQWSKLQAVQEDALYAFPADLFGWDTPEPRWILGLTWLATKIHPDRFADIDMQEQVYAFFGELYGLSQEQVDDIIMPKVNVDVD